MYNSSSETQVLGPVIIGEARPDYTHVRNKNWDLSLSILDGFGLGV